MEDRSIKTKILIVGGILGCVTGIIAAHMLIQRAEKDGSSPKLSTGEGIKLGALVFTALRQIALLGG
jgi:hypothetical protein